MILPSGQSLSENTNISSNISPNPPRSRSINDGEYNKMLIDSLGVWDFRETICFVDPRLPIVSSASGSLVSTKHNVSLDVLNTCIVLWFVGDTWTNNASSYY